jgi:tetratricopeptide (TPR) repeat protein
MRLLFLILGSAVAVTVHAQALVTIPPEADPNDWEAYFDAGVAALRTAPSDAAAALVEASRRDPSRAEPYIARYVAFWLSRTVRDFADYRSGDRKAYDDPAVRAADSLYLLALVRNPFVHRGLEALLYDRGQRLLTTADTRGWVAYSAGNFREAVAVYTRAIERDSVRTLWQRRERALSKVGYGDLLGAQQDLEFLLRELRRRDATDADVEYYSSKHGLLHMIGLLQTQRRQFAPAREAFLEALVEDAGFAYAHAGLGTVARAERNARGAVEAFGQAVLLAPRDPVLRQSYAASLLDAGDLDGAVTEARAALQAEPLWAAPYLTLARALERRGAMGEARAAYEAFIARATRTDPNLAAARAKVR